MNFSIEENEENDSIIKAATRIIKMRTIQNLLFSQTLPAVRINNEGAPLSGLAKSIYCFIYYIIFSFYSNCGICLLSFAECSWAPASN